MEDEIIRCLFTVGFLSNLVKDLSKNKSFIDSQLAGWLGFDTGNLATVNYNKKSNDK